MPFAQLPLINTHADVSGDDSGRIFCLSLHLHTHFVYASNDKPKTLLICEDSTEPSLLEPGCDKLGTVT